MHSVQFDRVLNRVNGLRSKLFLTISSFDVNFVGMCCRDAGSFLIFAEHVMKENMYNYQNSDEIH